jgi:hypothetical protein
MPTTRSADEIADMVFTDPPYNVDYANTAKDKMRGKDRPILNDNLGDWIPRLPVGGTDAHVAHCRGGIYVAMSSSELDVLQSAFRAAGGTGRRSSSGRRTPSHSGMRTISGSTSRSCTAGPRVGLGTGAVRRDQGDVWQIKKPHKNDLHPTMKPVELVERAVRNSSRPGDIVLDSFGGSGTTMIAAEKVRPQGAADRTGSEVRRCDRAPLAGLCRGEGHQAIRWRGVRRAVSRWGTPAGGRRW